MYTVYEGKREAKIVSSTRFAENIKVHLSLLLARTYLMVGFDRLDVARLPFYEVLWVLEESAQRMIFTLIFGCRVTEYTYAARVRWTSLGQKGAESFLVQAVIFLFCRCDADDVGFDFFHGWGRWMCA